MIKKMMDIGDWLNHYKLNNDLEGYLQEFGVELIEDLADLFKDEDLLQKCRAGMSHGDSNNFVEAYKAYMSENLKCESANDEKSHASSKSKHDEEHDKRTRRIAVMEKKLTKAATMDVLIMLDCTGSMGAYIYAAKARIRTFVKTIGETYPDIPLRIGFIGYRDIFDRERLVTVPLQSDLATFEAQLSRMRAGGGNVLTDLTSALKIASEQDWSSAIRVLFHIGDYPCRGLEYHDFPQCECPGTNPKGYKPEQFVQILADKKVNYCFGQLTHHTDKMIALINKRIGHEYIKSSPMNSNTMMEVITSSATALLTTSLSSSSSTDSSGTAHLRECTLAPEMPTRWEDLHTEQAVSYSMVSTSSVEHLCSDAVEKLLNDFPEPEPVFVKSSEHPFSKGRSKLAYYAQVVQAQDDPRAVSDSPLRALKESVYSSKAYATKEKFEEYLAPQRAALFLSSAYNKVRPVGTPSIEFVSTSLLQFLARPGKPYFIEETYIPGEWERYNNNTGYCAPFPTALGTNHHAVQAFSHWTDHVSGGRLMITDCQGCFDAARNAFVLTDPAVHSVSLLAYGGTNMGKKGFERFFKTHRCCDTCRALGLSAPVL